MNEIINIAAVSTPDSITFKDKRLTEATKKILGIYQDAAKYAETKNREIASILSDVKNGKSYEADGFKSVGEYAEKVFGLKKNNAYALATAGDVYNDATASDALKALSPSKIAEVSRLDRSQVEADLKSGKISSDSTQKELRAYVSNTKAIESKPEVLDQYVARMVSPFFPDTIAAELDSPRIIDEWDEFFKEYLINANAPARTPEVIKLPKCAPFSSPLLDKKPVNRRLYISENACIAVEFYTYKPEKEKVKPTAQTERKFTVEELRAMIAEMEEADAQVHRARAEFKAKKVEDKE